jgi:excisionase family DNA binding protein
LIIPLLTQQEPPYSGGELSARGDFDAAEHTCPGGAMTRHFKVPEVAQQLNLSPKTIWKKIGARELEVVRFGRAVRISEVAVLEWIEKSTMPAKF